MRKPAILGCLVLLSATLLAQQPVPMGKTSDSAKNYRAADGATLSKNSSDDDLTRALNESYSNDPEFSDVRVQVKHRKVTLAGTVLTTGAKRRAEKMAAQTAGVRDVRDHMKIGESGDRAGEVLTSSAQ
jgi:osmotically-inducible protein OsmY